MAVNRNYTPLLVGLGIVVIGTTGGILWYRSKYLSRDFKRSELTISPTAKDLGIEEQFNPPNRIVRNARHLAVKVLQPVRNKLGKAIFVNSWYRSPELNKIIGGVPTSDHLDAEGVDLRTVVDGLFRNDLLAKAVLDSGVPFTQLILEEGTLNRPKWIHLARRRGDNKRQILRMKNKKYSTLTETDIRML